MHDSPNVRSVPDQGICVVLSALACAALLHTAVPFLSFFERVYDRQCIRLAYPQILAHFLRSYCTHALCLTPALSKGAGDVSLAGFS